MSTLYVKITDNCNLNCSFCYVKQKESLLYVDKFREVLYTHNEITRVVLHGGEPLLFPAVCKEVLDICQKRQLPVSITSNLAMELNSERKDFLRALNASQKGVSIATSYSRDRFARIGNTKDWKIFLKNTQWLHLMNIPFTLLVTLSLWQIAMDSPDKLAETIAQINPANVTIERLYFVKNEDRIPMFGKITDDYMIKLFKRIPKEKNNLRSRMLDSIQFGVPVFNTKCGSLTLETNGTLIGCPNLCGKKSGKQHRKECIECEFYKWCMGDCPSFRDECSFPKQTFKKVMEGEL